MSARSELVSSSLLETIDYDKPLPNNNYYGKRLGGVARIADETRGSLIFGYLEAFASWSALMLGSKPLESGSE